MFFTRRADELIVREEVANMGREKGYNGVRTYNVLENGVKIRAKLSRSDGLPE